MECSRDSVPETAGAANRKFSFISTLHLQAMGDHVQAEDILDVLIIGAGPCAISVASRLLAGETSDWLSDKELDKIHYWKTFSKSHPTQNELKVMAIDPAGDWMSRWNTLFGALDIKYLRSPLFFHMDPFDSDGLLSYAHTHGRTGEIMKTDQLFVSAKKEKKNKKQFNFEQQWQFERPSARLFHDFSEQLIERYHLSERIVKGKVVDVDIMEEKLLNEKPIFKVTLDNGSVYLAKSVVSAIGQQLQCPQFNIQGTYPPERLKHALDPIKFSRENLDEAPHEKVLILGGGLTAAQLALKAARSGYKQVTMVSRRTLKQKYFDMDAEWVGRFRSVHMEKFFGMSDPKERWECIKKARGGGSVTPEVLEDLRSFSKSHEDLLQIREQTSITSMVWNDSQQYFEISLSSGEICNVHHIWCATGMKRSVEHDPVFKNLLQKFPIDVVEGFPILTQDLRWKEGVDFFVGGAYAALSLGPDAFNLIGGRRSSERIVNALMEGRKEQGEEDEETMPLYFQSNVYSVLQIEA